LISKFRLSSHQLQIEKGRYKNTLRSKRIYLYCNLHEVEDEFHFVFICPKYDRIRTNYILGTIIELGLLCTNYVQFTSIQNRKQLCNYLKICLFIKTSEQCPSSITVHLYCNSILYIIVIIVLYMYIAKMLMNRKAYS